MRDEIIQFHKEVIVQTEDEDEEVFGEFRLLSKKEMIERLREVESERDRVNGEKNYLKKNIDSLKQEYSKYLKKMEECERQS
mmetsp:Transcript_17738/g.16971  ORF Transcript_17738/g.16971 Transcript_17738/m.16971 type:complete len:82 (+) Transcript_17738:1271-1516(+)